MRDRRNGLTLVELVVGICALGTLLSISLPAIQMGREGARGVVCQQNLQIIGLASLDYDDTFGELPPYMGIPDNLPDTSDFFMALNYQLTYPLTQLLDFVGYSDLAEQVDPFAFSNVNATIQTVGYKSFQEWLPGISAKLPGIEAIAFDVQIPEFRCPADAGAPTNTVLLGPHPTNINTTTVFLILPGELEYSVTNYAANVGAIFVTDTPANPEDVGFHGPIRSRRSDSVETISDGASNVILFGESLGSINNISDPVVNRRYSMSMGGLACGSATRYGTDTNFGTMKESLWIQFASGHPDLVNFVFADGSVRSLDRNIPTTLIGRLCGVADGLPVFSAAGN